MSVLFQNIAHAAKWMKALPNTSHMLLISARVEIHKKGILAKKMKLHAVNFESKLRLRSSGVFTYFLTE